MHRSTVPVRVFLRETGDIYLGVNTYDVLKDRLSTDQSRLKYLGDVQQFYDHQVRFEGAKYNPLDGANDQFRWEIDTPDNKTVDADGMRAIYEAADSIDSQLLVLALGLGAPAQRGCLAVS